MTTKTGNWIAHAEWLALMAAIIGGVFMMNSKIDQQMSAQTARTDKLYEMFIDLVKETRGG